MGASVRSTRRRARGFTLLELCMTMGVVVVMTAIAVPVVKSSLNAYKLSSSVSSVTSAVQTTRYKAIQYGYPFQVVFTAATSKYQILSDPTDTGAFANVGNPVVFTTVPNMLGTTTTFTFRPGGAVQSTWGTTNCATPISMTFTYLSVSKTMTVGCYGNVTVPQ